MGRIIFKNKLAWVYLAIMVCLTFTVIPGWLTFVRKEWALLVLGTLTAMVLSTNYFYSKLALCLYAYFIILFLNMLSGDVTYNTWPIIIYEILQFLVPSVIFFYMQKRSDEVFARSIVVVVLAIVCIESVASFFIDRASPNIIRELESMTRAEGDRSFAYNFMRRGLADYSFCHALPILIPPLICWIKDKSIKRKWIIWGVLFLTCMLIYISASSTALFLLVFILVLSLFTRVSNRSKSINALLIITIVFAPFLFSRQIQFITIDAASSVLPQDSYAMQKLESIRYSLEYESSEGDVEARVVRYTQSFDGFKENVLFGSNGKLGGHSGFLDRLGSLGLMGIAPLLIFLIMQFKTTLKCIPDKYKLFYYEGMIAALLIFALKAVSLLGILFLLFMVMPYMLMTSFNRKSDE